MNYKGLLTKLTESMVFMEATNKRMAKGMKVDSPAVRVLKFNTSKSEFLQVDVLLTNEDRDSLVSN